MKILGGNGECVVLDSGSNWILTGAVSAIINKMDQPNWWKAATSKWGYTVLETPMSIESPNEVTSELIARVWENAISS